MKRLVVFLIYISPSLFAQDIIVKNDKSEINVKVLEILEREIKYKKWHFLEGPVYSMWKDEIFMIIYENGKRETFGEVVSPPVQPVPARVQAPVEKSQKEAVTLEAQTIARTGKPKEDIVRVPDFKYIFLPRDRSKPKSKTNRSEGYDLWGVRLNPNYIGGGFSYGRDRYRWRNNIGLHSDFEVGGGAYTVSEDALLLSYSIGPNYAFNNLLKIDKEKAALFAGVYFRALYMYDLIDIHVLSGTMGIRAGGSLAFSRKIVGAFGELRMDGYGATFKIGLSFKFRKY